jgi:hypothetical protein
MLTALSFGFSGGILLNLATDLLKPDLWEAKSSVSAGNHRTPRRKSKGSPTETHAQLPYPRPDWAQLSVQNRTQIGRRFLKFRPGFSHLQAYISLAC